MLLRRTRAHWKRKAQSALFEGLGMQAMLDERERHALEDSMGFRGQWDEHRRFQIEELKRLGLKPHSSFMEIGCGPLTAGVPVIAYLQPDRYVGVDIRSSVLNMAWVQIGKAQLSDRNPRLINAEDFGASQIAGRKFDFIWSFSVLYHLTDNLVDRLFAHVANHMNPQGRFVANVMVDMESSTWLQFPFLRRSIDEYAAAAKRRGLHCTPLGTIADRGFRLPGAERNNELLQFTLA